MPWGAILAIDRARDSVVGRAARDEGRQGFS